MVAPKSLFRFYGKIDFAEEFLASKELAIPHYSKLNDPFDPGLFIYGDSSWKNAIKDWQKSENDMRKQILRDTYIACFCAHVDNQNPRDNLYMWGHYANGHRGLAIEFDYNILQRCIKDLGKNIRCACHYNPSIILCQIC